MYSGTGIFYYGIRFLFWGLDLNGHVILPPPWIPPGGGVEVSRGIIKSNQVCHYSVLHRVLPKIAALVSQRRQARQRTTVIYLFETDASLGDIAKQELLDMAGMAAVVWPGYYKKRSGGLYERSYGQVTPPLFVRMF